MGQEINVTEFNEDDYHKFREILEDETKRLTSLYEDNALSQDGLTGGFEVETWLLNEAYQPAPVNKEFIKTFDSPLASQELAKFNLEFNNTPQRLTGSALTRFHQELDDIWQLAEKTASQLKNSSSLLLIGTLPTLDLSDLNINSMSDMNRYRALNNEIMHRRKEKPVHLNIQGKEHLDIYSHDVMLEAATTSFQIHTQVPAKDAHHYYNASIIISAAMVAITANSPYAFGKELWGETRIPLFEQSIDTNNPKAPTKRVSFGSDFAKKSILECFHENLNDFHILLPTIEQQNEKLPHLRLHNGTIWRWNRPLIGFDEDNQPHIRIEHRAIAAGPTIIDMVANAAFYYGLQEYWAQRLKRDDSLPDFATVKNNFYTAAAGDLNSTIDWYGKSLSLHSLLGNELLSQAKEGLKHLEILSNDNDKYLGIIEGRINNQQTGANWQKKYVNLHRCDMTELTHAYQALQRTGQPVHTWSTHRSSVDKSMHNESLELRQLDSYPRQLLEIRAEELYTIFPKPTLLHLQGMRPETVFISVLLHGNETTGFYVVQELLKKYRNTRLPRSVSIFFGNIEAARHGVRLLNTQHDYNRVWPGTHYPYAKEAKLMKAVINEMQTRNLFTSIDIHNNTGLNPHYACINKLGNEFLHLAALFAPTAVYFLTPKGVQSNAFSDLCPAVTLECGKADAQSGMEHALEYVEAVLHMSAIPQQRIATQDLHLFHTIARVKIPKNVSFSFSDEQATILFNKDLEKMNFSEMPADTCFGKINNTSRTLNLAAFNDDNEDIGSELFYIAGDKILLKHPMMPAMLTLDEKVIRQDCLCYMMERMPLPRTE